MKIQKITLKNLNSLAGTWTLDLSHPAYTDDGIFAITGPTGAGKTTILDAVSLALYGRTPRLSRISTSTNEIMHRQAADCLAEVEYLTATGTYRCTWAQERAHRKADGNLQQPRHEIADAATGEILATKKREVQQLVEESCGMDYERFTRSVMLAQGAFAAFLHASPDERSPLLEQITGTEIYSEISIAVHTRTRTEREELAVLKAEAEGIILLSPEERERLYQSRTDLAVAGAALTEEIATVRDGIVWHRDMARITTEISAIGAERADLVEQTALAQEGLRRLETDARAAALQGDYRSLATLRAAQDHDHLALEGHREDLTALREARLQAESEVSKQQAALTGARAAAGAMAPVLREAREFDLRIKAASERVDELDQAFREEEEGWTQAAAALRQILAAGIRGGTGDESGSFLAAQGITGAPAEEYGALCRAAVTLSGTPDDAAADAGGALTHACDETERRITELQASLAAVPSYRDPAVIRREETAAQQAKTRLILLLEGIGRLQQDRDRRAELAARIRETERDLEAGKAALGVCRKRMNDKERLIREMEENARNVAIIKNYEEERRHLREGEACHLCGATSHPFTTGDGLPRDGTEELQREQEALARIREEDTSLRTAIVRGESVLEGARREQADIDARAEAARSTWAVACRENGLDAGAADQSEEVRSALGGIEERFLRIEAEERGVAACTHILRATETLILHCRQAVAARQKWRVSASRRAEGAADLSCLRERRRLLPLDSDPATMEERMSREIRMAEEAMETAREDHMAALHAITGREGEMRNLEGALLHRGKEIAQKERSFAAMLGNAGFTGEEEFVSSLLSPGERAVLETERSRLTAWGAGLDGRVRSAFAEREAHLLRSRPSAVMAALKEGLTALSAAHEENAAAIGEVRQQLTSDERERARSGEQQRRIDCQRAETDRWEQLHTLIGSADGKKFRNYAQGLTFERMVAAANRQLRVMSDRYILVRSAETPLDLSVIDNYQGGRIRSTRNLSGGESFLVSLALALGLASMASGRVRVDSLFLDEGFGTLDDDALEMALSTLTSLRDQGKLIGVISHVPALKERIGTTISVRRSGGGTSVLEGPGIARLRT
ncbi:MAG TPA: hypothetical protein ENN44_03615 [Methanoculleus sp.]|nr:hypothetical protein [Methanoculleus sp.]